MLHDLCTRTITHLRISCNLTKSTVLEGYVKKYGESHRKKRRVWSTFTWLPDAQAIEGITPVTQLCEGFCLSYKAARKLHIGEPANVTEVSITKVTGNFKG